MKKIFTLLFSVGIVGSVFAQPNHQNSFKVSHDIAFNKAPDRLMNSGTSLFNDGYSFNNNDKDRQIKEINRDFDRQIMSVKFNRHLRPYEKNRQIRMLEMQRDQKIRQINDRFSSYGQQGHDRFNHKW